MSYRNLQPSDNSFNNLQSQVLGRKKETVSETKSRVNNNPPQISRDQQYNCIFNVIYNGEPRQFALSGQLLERREEFSSLPPLA